MSSEESQDQFKAEILSTLTKDDAAFRAILKKAMSLFVFSAQDLSDDLGVARSTVDRWRSGAAIPTPGMRRIVLDALIKRGGMIPPARTERDLLKEEIAATPIQDADAFAAILRKSFSVLGMTSRDFADALNMGTFTVNRWLRGDVAPAILVRRYALEELLKNCES